MIRVRMDVERETGRKNGGSGYHDVFPRRAGYNGATFQETLFMNQGALGWILLGIVMLVFSAAGLVFGVSLLPPAETKQSKQETTVPLILTWGMIWVTTLSGVVMAIYILAYGLGRA